MKKIVMIGLVVLSTMPATRVEAQTLRDDLGGLFTFGSCGRPLCLDGSVSAANGHGDHFLPTLAAGNATIISFLSSSIAANTASVPTTASASGITYRFVGGVPVRTSESVGPIFVERAHTMGKGQLLIGGRFSSANLKTLRGLPLDQIDLNFAHQDVGKPGLGDPDIENDVLQARLDIGVGVNVTSFFATYGVSNDFDLSLIVPMVHTSLQARAFAQMHPFGSPAVHFFSGTLDNPGLTAASATYGSYTGVGDIGVRGKMLLHSTDEYAVGLLTDVRLPTGDEANFAGAGHLSVRASLLTSVRFGDFTSHFNAGYFARAGDDRNDVISVTAGFDNPLSDWASIAVEFISDWQPGANKTVLPEPVIYQFPFRRVVQPTNIPGTKDNQVLTSVGAKFRPTSNGPIILVDMLVPVLRGGLQPNVMWTLGLDLGI